MRQPPNRSPTKSDRELRDAAGEPPKRSSTELQGETPLVHVCVDSQAVAETVAAWTGIPVGRMVTDEIKTVLNLKELMEESIVGQSHALERDRPEHPHVAGQPDRSAHARSACSCWPAPAASARPRPPSRWPNLLYGGEQNMTVINMSEFKEEHKVSLLMGSPPGYVGYGEGGVLTEAVRRKPYSVVLLDEMEKAHPGVQDIFYQVFDKGTMRDGEGRDIDFKNTVIMMTTNAGTDFIKSLCADPGHDARPGCFRRGRASQNCSRPSSRRSWAASTSSPIYPLSDDVMKKIVELKLGKVGQRIQENYQAGFSLCTRNWSRRSPQRCTEVDTGARNVDHILTRTLLPELSAEFLARMAEGESIKRAHVGVAEEGTFRYEVE